MVPCREAPEKNWMSHTCMESALKMKWLGYVIKMMAEKSGYLSEEHQKEKKTKPDGCMQRRAGLRWGTTEEEQSHTNIESVLKMK